MAQCLPDRHVFDMRFGPSFFFQFGNEPTPFVRSQPSDFLRPVRKDEERCNSQNERRKSFQQKEPAPTGEIQPMNAENFSGNRTSDDKTDRDRGHESRNGCGTVLINEPMRKINDHARKEPRLCCAEQKARAVKLVRTVHKTS